MKLNLSVFKASAVAVAVLGSSVCLADGGALFAQRCQSCHGANGNSPSAPTYPKIGDLTADEIKQAFAEYRAGSRKTPTALVMNGLSATVSDADLEAIANYLGAK